MLTFLFFRRDTGLLGTCLVAATALLLGGCAQLPASPPLRQPETTSALVNNESFSAPSAAWPNDAWWTQYQDPQLNALIEEALSTSPTMALAQSRLRLAQAFEQQNDAALKPQLSANLEPTEQRQSYNYLMPSAATPHGWNDYGLASLNFGYEIDFWGKNRAALAAATSEREAEAADVALARLSLSAAVASTYADLTKLYAEKEIATEALRVRDDTLALVQQRVNEGLDTAGSAKQAESKQAAATASLQAVDEAIGLTRNALAMLVGAGPDRGLSIGRPAIELTSDFGLPPHLALDLVGRRPDIVAAKLRVEAASKRIHVAKAQFYPNVNLMAVLGLESFGLDMLTRSGSQFGSVGPAISLPIFNGGNLKAQYRSAQANYDAAVANYDAALVQALREVADATVSEKALAGQLNSTQQAVDAAEAAYKIALSRYQGGLSNYLDVLTAEDSLLQTQQQLTNLQARRFSLNISLVRALGGGYELKVAQN